jgi:hypothetical protein
MLSHGYTVTREFCGRPHGMHVVRQYGEWVQCYDTRRAAIAAVTARGGHLSGT